MALGIYFGQKNKSETTMASEAWATAAAIASIAFAFAIYYTSTAWFEHRERMAKLEQGIDPDQADQEKNAK